MTTITAVAILLALFAVFITTTLSLIILFHLNRYAVPGDHTTSARRAFLAGNGVFFVLTIIAVAMLWL